MLIKEFYLERKEYSQPIEKRMRSLKDGYRQNLAIIGDELIGKTSLIFKALNEFYDTHIITIYIEARPESISSFAKRFIGSLLYNFLLNSGISLKEDLEFLIDKSSRHIPRTIEKIRLILAELEKRRRNNIFSQLLSLCESLNQETSKSCVVIFDEFHNLEDIGVKNIYSEWSKLLLTQKNTMYIIISSLKFKAKAILSKNLSLLFGNFETITVEPFTTQESESYLEERLKEANINKGLKDFIVYFTGGCPFYLKLICDALLKVNRANIYEIIEDMLFDSSGILHQKFSNYIKRFLDCPHSQDYIAILYLVSSGHNKVRDIAGIMHKSKKEFDCRISRLMELEAITRSADFLKINDRIFSFWVKFVYQQKLNSMTFDTKNQKMLFLQSLDQISKDFFVNSQKPIIERLAELLRMFENDTVQIERKRFRLSHFREIKAMEFNHSSLKHALIGRTGDAVWIVGFKQSQLTEEDICEFSRECKKFRNKPQKKIVVGFSGIDLNARLRAMEEKILTWDVNNLNQLLDLYSQPRMIV